MSRDAQPFDMIIIGASGDLARRKLVPALYNLHRYGLPEGRIFGVARNLDNAKTYFDQLEKSTREQVGETFEKSVWKAFVERFHRIDMSATHATDYDELKERLGEHPERVRVFYLATPPRLYGDISQTLAEVGLVTASTRIVLEKPIGSDLESAQEINERVGRFFEEPQIYRIDHYLGK
ncbi:MAG: glucose-6-phosphate dehydrogenase, partial [Acidobacteriota bacterium]